MVTLSSRSRNALLMPLVLILVVLLEELAAVYLRQRVSDPRLRIGLLLACYGFGFAFAADVVVPRLRRTLGRAQSSTRRRGGDIGVVLFYLAAYGALYYAFFIAETRGFHSLLPAALR